MRKYGIPEMKIMRFDIEDVITQSGNGVIVNSAELTGASKEMYEIYSNNSQVDNTKVSVFTW